MNNPEEILKQLKSGTYSPVYFLQGEEAFYIDRIAEYIENHALPDSARGFDQVIIYGKDVDMQTVLTQAKRFPMMAERQVVILKEGQDLMDARSQDWQKQLMGYLDQPLDSTILVLCYKYKKLNPKTALAKKLDQQAVMITSSKLYDNQVPDWITRYVKSRKFRITDKATAMILEFVGNNLSRITHELDKLMLNLEEKGSDVIDEQGVEKYVGVSKEYNVFELQRALSRKDVVRVHKIINYFASNPKANPIIPVIAFLFTYFSNLLAVHFSRKNTERDIAALLNIRPFFAKEYIQALPLYSLNKTIQIIHYLRKADLEAKGVDGQRPEDQILKELVFRILH